MDFVIPPLQIDPRTLPPVLLTSEPGSFAYNTLKVRVPGIIDDTLAGNTFPPEVTHRVLDLRREITDGVVRPLQEETPDRDFWTRVSRDYFGRTWLDVPWYWAEAYFYRRMLEATGYFQPGPMHGFDPYRAKKQTELAANVAPRAVTALLQTQAAATGEEATPRARFLAFLYSSLWGNRIDLSYNVSVHVGRGEQLQDEQANLIVDDSTPLWEFMQVSPRREIALITDNAGTELTMDLALIDFLLQAGLERVVLHCKPQPFFVSDAMPEDVDATLDALAQGEPEARTLAARLRTAIATDRLVVFSHWFYTSSLFNFQMPADLRAALARADLIILKGDANYRRLVGDAHWPPSTPFAEVTRYMPAPHVALRTLKAETIVGLRPGEADKLARVDPQWMVNGKRGIVQARL